MIVSFDFHESLKTIHFLTGFIFHRFFLQRLLDHHPRAVRVDGAVLVFGRGHELSFRPFEPIRYGQ